MPKLLHFYQLKTLIQIGNKLETLTYNSIINTYKNQESKNYFRVLVKVNVHIQLFILVFTRINLQYINQLFI